MAVYSGEQYSSSTKKMFCFSSPETSAVATTLRNECLFATTAVLLLQTDPRFLTNLSNLSCMSHQVGELSMYPANIFCQRTTFFLQLSISSITSN